MNPGAPSDPKEGAFATWRRTFWTRMVTRSEPPRRRRFMALTFGLVACIGLADFFTGFELSLLVFYLVPVCLAVAAVDWRFGTLVAVTSVATWLAGDFAAGAHFANPVVPVWNALIALGTYLVVVWLLASVIALQREMEERVRQRTAALTNEIAERVRLEKAVLEVTERERRAIGHDLHDGLGQHLTGTALVAQALGSRLAARGDAEARDMGKIVDLIEKGIEQTRGLAKGLLLAEIASDGLVPALEEMAASLQEQFRVTCRLSYEGAVDLGEGGTATHLYRIAQEAARNAVRHGGARTVTIALTEPGGRVTLQVSDDGSGLAPPEARGEGLGLRIMAHRAAMIGATFSVAPGPQVGTVVTCQLPPR